LGLAASEIDSGLHPASKYRTHRDNRALLHAEINTIRGQTGSEARRHAWRIVTASGCPWNEHGHRIDAPHNVHENRRRGVCCIRLQACVVGDDNAIDSGLGKLLSGCSDVCAE
jgi:hypothetical protein